MGQGKEKYSRIDLKKKQKTSQANQQIKHFNIIASPQKLHC